MLIVEAIVAVVIAVVFVGTYRDAKNGPLPLQNSVGIKTRGVMSSEETWNRIHKRYAPLLLFDACALFLVALEILVGGWLRKSINDMTSGMVIALVITLVLALLVNLIVGLSADRAAWKQNNRWTRAFPLSKARVLGLHVMHAVIALCGIGREAISFVKEVE